MSGSVVEAPSPKTPEHPPGLGRLGKTSFSHAKAAAWTWFNTIVTAVQVTVLPSHLQDLWSNISPNIQLPSWLELWICKAKLPTYISTFTDIGLPSSLLCHANNWCNLLGSTTTGGHLRGSDNYSITIDQTGAAGVQHRHWPSLSRGETSTGSTTECSAKATTRQEATTPIFSCHTQEKGQEEWLSSDNDFINRSSSGRSLTMNKDSWPSEKGSSRSWRTFRKRWPGLKMRSTSLAFARVASWGWDVVRRSPFGATASYVTESSLADPAALNWNRWKRTPRRLHFHFCFLHHLICVSFPFIDCQVLCMFIVISFWIPCPDRTFHRRLCLQFRGSSNLQFAAVQVVLHALFLVIIGWAGNDVYGEGGVPGSQVDSPLGV